jgi:nicotinamidase/pyrazinamidase
MTRALMIVDVQKYFTASIPGGSAVAARISEHLRDHAGEYDLIVACRDWHDGDNDNGGHFAWNGEEPDLVTSWPVHCVAGEPDGDYDPNLATDLIDIHIKKGQGKPDYSIFGGITDDGESFPDLVSRLDIRQIDACGLSANGCVQASVLDALAAGVAVTLLTDLTASRSAEAVITAAELMRSRGATIS